jgi:ABC-type transporter Mla maintaining outer membrane lipid asymmetry ATPase subunit MlaF
MIHEGRIIEEGPPQDILKSTDPLIRQFIEGKLDGPLQPL